MCFVDSKGCLCVTDVSSKNKVYLFFLWINLRTCVSNDIKEFKNVILEYDRGN